MHKVKLQGLNNAMDGGFQSLDGMYSGRFGPGTTPSDGLQGVVPSTCFHLDATDTGSYSGSGQVWANLTAVPADGSSKTDYDFYLGNTSSPDTDDPTFNGTPGSPSAYWSTDGGDYFTSIVRSPSPGILKNMHKTTGGTAWWIAIAYYRVGSGGTSTAIWNSGRVNSLRLSATNSNYTFQNTYLGSATLGPPTNDTPQLLILSGKANDFTNIRRWMNTRTATEFNFGAGSGATDTAGPAMIFRQGAGLAAISGTRCYAFVGGNAYLDNTAAGAIFDYFNTKHGRTYA